MKELKGIIAPVPTPFKDDEELALDRLGENLTRWAKTRLSGFVLLGSTGEFVYLTHDEKKAVFEKARQIIPADKLMLAGTGCESTRQTIELTQWAGALGIDYAMVINPFYYKRGMKPEILRAHYLAVADASPVPIVLYNMPPFTGLNLEADLVIELASHPNIAGMKDSAGDVLQLQEICRSTPESFSVLTGSGSLLLACLTVGAKGGILAVANVAYDLAADLYEAFGRGDFDRARTIQGPLAVINKAVTVQYGIGGVKALLDHLGYYGGPPRRPLRRATDEVKAALARIHAQSGTPEVNVQ